MGTVDRRLLCGTCCRDVKECQGHVGHIELSFPMYHIGFFDMCFKTLRCVCYSCSKLLLTQEEISNLGDEVGKSRFIAVYNIVKTRKKCCNCGMVQPTYGRLSLSIKCEFPPDVEWESEEEKQFCSAPFTQRDALSILTHITEEDAKILGFNSFCNPKDLVMLTVLVPPPVARPAIMASEGSRSRGQDDLTHKLQDINKRSIELQNAMGEKTWREIEISVDLQDRINRLQFEVFTYMNNNIRGQKQSTQRSGAPTKSITDRLRGKDGRIRGNLMGKRVDFSARSVITPDAVMDVDQVGIPYRVAMSMTIPERVTSYNIEEMTQRIANGPTQIFGAETVITSNGVMINLAHCENREKIRLQFGWIVERFLQDDDIVVFNRQPSLHKVGMMGHRVKLMPGNTFRLNLCCANPYNADFDGDEMNLHVPQSPAAMADVATIMMVSRQIISPQANRPVMGIVQDSLLGAHLFSSDDVLLDRITACHIVAHIRYSPHKLPLPCIAHPCELWSGKQLLSLILPPTMTMGLLPKTKDIAEHTKVLIRNGNLLTGAFKKASLGTSAGGVVDILFRQFGSVVTVRWMSDIQRLVNSWLCLQGFSVGIKDCVMSKTGEEKVKKRVETAMRYAMELLHEPVAQGTNEAQVLEATVVRILSKCLMQTGGVVDEELGQDNAIRKMVEAGSKGNPINLSQICGCVGQQSVEGHRVFAEKGGRTLSCFPKHDNSLAGQGFVQNSYALGLHPHEYFFHAMGGREGLVDTAVKTATTGYIQRRQMKAMEDHKVFYDGTIRNAGESIVDFSYGGDGMDPTKVERIALNFLEKQEAQLAQLLTPWELKTLLALKARILLCKHERPIDTRVLLPYNPLRIELKLNSSTSPASRDELETTLKENVLKTESLVMRFAFIEYFNSMAMSKKKISLADYHKIFKDIARATNLARVNPGEMVGSIAAQSIGEPCTQMCNRFSNQILVQIDGKMRITSIGALIDSYLPPIASPEQHDIMDISDLKCVGVTPTEQVAWASVKMISRHPANGDMLTVATQHRQSFTMTASHAFLVRSDNRVVARAGYKLVVGDCLPIVKDLPFGSSSPEESPPIPLNRETGRFIGAIVAEGTVGPTDVGFDNSEFAWLVDMVEAFGKATDMRTYMRKYKQTGLGTLPMMIGGVYNREFADWMAEHFGRTSFNKKLPGWILDAPDEFVTGLLQTYFDGDGNVQTEARHHRLCCHSVSTELITMLCLCLARYGIVTYVGTEAYKTPAGSPGTIHRITIPMCFAAKFQEHIGFSIERKVEKLAQVVKEQEAVGMRGFQAHIPGMNEVLEEVRKYIPSGGDKNSFETLLRKEFRRIQRKTGITPKMLMRCREHAVKFNAPTELVAELDQAIHADVWWDPIVSIEIEKDSTEMVYDFTVDDKLQSFMLSNGVFVHNTLNSVDWNTTMAIHWTGATPPAAPHDAEVGAFIDALIDERPADCQVQADGKTIYLPLEPGTAVALSPDEDGRMMWTELEAVTRHPPINKDGSNTLVEVTTDSGRTVTVTKGKSLLVEREGKLVEVEGDDVAVGDRVPVVAELPPVEHQDTLDLHTVFRETEAVFTNTMIEAMEATKHNRHWFLKGGFKSRSCYSRSDIMREAVKNRPALLEADQVVWPHGGNFFPMRIPLDRDFGFFLGAYLAEGCVTDHQVHIANVDPEFRDAARVWPERHGIKSHETKDEHQHKNNGVSICVMFHSTILVELVVRTCGKLSAGKRVPGFAFAAPDDFVRGLLDGYISGDGSINKKQAMITASSRSQKLRDGVALLLTRFGIGCRLTQQNAHSHVLWTKEDDGTRTQTKYGDKIPMYNLTINAEGTRRFAEEVDLVLAYKQDRCTAILEDTHPYKVSKRYATMRNVRLEEIVALNDVESSHEFVYDLTVAQTRNMTATNGLGLADTFHLSGVGNKGVTMGIPRLKELLDQAKQIKTPCNTIHFKGDLGKSPEFASFFASTLPLTRLSDIISSCDFVFDPDPHVTVVEADAFMVEMNERIGVPVNDDLSRYVIRLILNQSVMNARRITPPMVRNLLRNRLRNRAHIISSETNSVDWIIRVRFEHVKSMMANLDHSREREGLLCHRVLSVMLDTIAISGHVHMSGAHIGTTEDINGKKIYTVETEGCNLIDLSAADCIDWYNTTSNDVNEVHAALGLEAAVAILYNELHTTISFDGTYVDPRHIMMIVNTMTRGGYIMPLSRHGINRMDTGPLLRCSFEETPDILCDAACFGECDNGRGVSQNIMTGKLPEIGTGAMHIKVASRLLHPRDTLHLNSNIKTKRVLKSSVRRRQLPSQAVEFMEVDRDQLFSCIDSMDIEVPFSSESNDSNMLSGNSSNIFGSNLCEAPYIESKEEVATKHSDESCNIRCKRDYRPSSPGDSDDDI